MDLRRTERQGSGQDGFTVVEVLVVLLLAALVSVAVLVSLSSMTGVFHRESVRIQNQDDARLAVNQMAEFIRAATSSVDNPSSQSNAVAAALPQDVEFYCDVDGDGIAEKLRYYLAGTSLMAQSAEPVWMEGSTPHWQYPGYETDGIVVQDAIRNGADPVFTYYRYNGSQLEEFTPTTDFLRRSVVAIAISLNVNERPDLVDTGVLLATSVQIRQRYDGGL